MTDQGMRDMESCINFCFKKSFCQADAVNSCESLSSLAGSRRSLDVDALYPPAQRTPGLMSHRTLSLRSLSALARLSSEVS